MIKPKISIIVPIYNVEKYLIRCIESLLHQSLTEIEIILVDDGSVDTCPQICDDYAKRDSRIKVIHKNNEGLGFARNSGMELVCGEYVAFVDSDDFVALEMYERLYSVATSNQKLDAVYCGINYFSEEKIVNSLVETTKEVLFYNDKIKNKFLLGMLSRSEKSRKIVEYEMSVWHAIYKFDVLEKNNITFCSERVYISEDIIFHIDFLKHAKSIGMIPKALYYYCYNNNSLTKTFRKDRFDKEKFLFQEILSRTQTFGFNEIQRKRISSFFILKTRFCISSLVENMNSLNYGFVRSEILLICNDYMVKQQIFSNLTLYPLRYRIIALLMKYNLVDIIIIMLLVPKIVKLWKK